MAGDWIKMRVWLSRDPRVIKMADYLSEQRPFMNWLTDPVRSSCKESAYEHVTRNVTVALCVTGLLVTWGTAREQGDRDGDDLVLSHCDKYTFDAVTDIECFGEAMEHVGWLRENENGSVTFPKFFKDNESPDEKHKRQNAERQARHREKQSRESNAEDNVTNNVTVTTEKRREEKSIETDTRFADFWSAYPVKKGKAAAEKAWKKARINGEFDSVVAALQSQAASCKDLAYFPHASTWINGRRWEDEVAGTNESVQSKFAGCI